MTLVYTTELKAELALSKTILAELVQEEKDQLVKEQVRLKLPMIFSDHVIVQTLVAHAVSLREEIAALSLCGPPEPIALPAPSSLPLQSTAYDTGKPS